MPKKLIEYQVDLRLADEVNLRLLLFSQTEHRWIFTHDYLKRESEERAARAILTNKTSLVVEYDKGIVSGIGLSMDIKRPDKRGKEYWLGMDISPGSHVFVEFSYEKKGELFRMKSIQTGVRKRFDLDSLAKSQLPLKQIDFPFPLKDRVENEFGEYKVPFLTNSDTESFFRFPKKYIR